jgi:hypothetical protein
MVALPDGAAGILDLLLFAELNFGVLMWTIPQWTGGACVCLVSFGQARCEEGLAEITGFTSWFTLALVVTIVVARG